MSGDLAVTPAPVTVTADSLAKAYGQDDPALTATVSGLVGPDSVSYSLSREPGEHVGTYAVTPSGDAEQGDYSVAYVAGALRIDKAREGNSVSATGGSKAYDGAALSVAASASRDGSTLSYSVDGGLTWSPDAPSLTHVGSAHVLVRATNPDFADATAEADLAVTPAPVTVTADSLSKAYGDDDPALTATVSGLVGPDSVSYSLSREPGEHVGTYAVTPSGDAE
ncbi:MAG: hypothetical protein LKK44_07745, partial [Atopobiaceae bacterium]|nr:hypothetical protein [Atopobiaceae bacterium]